MNCNDLVLALEQCVERREELDHERFAPHLAECTECRRRVADYRLLESALAHWTDADDGPDLTQRVLDALVLPQIAAADGDIRGYRRIRFALVAGLLVATAAAVVIVIGTSTADKRPRVDSDRPLGGEAGFTFAPASAVDYETLVTDTRIALGSLMNETDRSLGGFAALIPQHAEREPNGSKGESENNKVGLARQLGDDLKPLGDQLRGSFAFLVGR